MSLASVKLDSFLEVWNENGEKKFFFLEVKFLYDSEAESSIVRNSHLKKKQNFWSILVVVSW